MVGNEPGSVRARLCKDCLHVKEYGLCGHHHTKLVMLKWNS